MPSNDNLIWVKAGQASEGNRVALLEYDHNHPSGQAFVYGEKSVQVYPTQEVKIRLREGFLEEVSGPTKEEPKRESGPSSGPPETAAQRNAREKREKAEQEKAEKEESDNQ